MKIKSFIIIIYIIAGLLISATSSFMTYLIIGVPIGMTMFIKIISAILLTLPIIGIISYFFSKFLSNKFLIIQNRLNSIKEENFEIVQSDNMIFEINHINKDMNELSSKLNKLISELKEKNLNLSTLLISMSHDIKTPITILNGYIEEIEDGIVRKEKLPEVLNNMKNEVKFLNELTLDMLDYISSMKNQKIKSKIHLYDFIQSEILILLAKNDDTEIINEIPNNFTIEFNKMDLKKVLLNILFNAIKHTSNGYVKIYIKNDEVLIQNNGQSIHKDYHKKIFEPFFTVDKSKNRQNNGFGLGLSIVKNLCQNNSYNCILKSSDEKSTIFLIKSL